MQRRAWELADLWSALGNTRVCQCITEKVYVCVCVCVSVVTISMCVGICTRFAAAARTAIDSYHAPQNAVTCLPSPPQFPSPSPTLWPPPTLSTTTLMMPAVSPSWVCQWIMPCARRGRACVRVLRVRPCNAESIRVVIADIFNNWRTYTIQTLANSHWHTHSGTPTAQVVV